MVATFFFRVELKKIKNNFPHACLRKLPRTPGLTLVNRVPRAFYNYDKCLQTLLMVHMNDIILNEESVSELYAQKILTRKFEIKNLDPPKYFLKME